MIEKLPIKNSWLVKVWKNNPTIAHNILYVKGEKILPAHISNHNSTREKAIILLMIPNREQERWHYLQAKKMATLLRGVTSKFHGDFCCLNCPHSFRTETNA